jgi:ABC-type nitrate/sulfonate/bicarbonate transport system substrate-binding protein
MTKKTRTNFLLNWYANPYHTPLFVAQELGYYESAGIKLALFEPTDPSDVTEAVGVGAMDLGLKAMIHTLAGRAKGFPIISLGTLLDEPPTGLLSLKSSGIHTFQDIVGKKIGYIGEFGKKIIDDLARLAGIEPASYETVRVGMNVTDAILRGKIDAGIGFINFQKVELEHLGGEANLLRIDQLAGLGCCCFCSIQFIACEEFVKAHPEVVKGFLLAIQRGAAFTVEEPEKAFDILCDAKPALRTEMHKAIFLRTLPFFSRNLLNIDRDWNKVYRYSNHLGILPESFELEKVYTNQYLPESPFSDLKPIACCV